MEKVPAGAPRLLLARIVIKEAHMEGVALRKRCQLALPIRDPSGRVRFRENPEVVREIDNLGRRMILVRFDDGATTFLFPYEVTILE